MVEFFKSSMQSVVKFNDTEAIMKQLTAVIMS